MKQIAIKCPHCSNEFELKLETSANMVVMTCKKFNQMMSSVSLISMISAQQIKEWNQYILAKVFGLLQERSNIDRMSEEQIAVMLMLPLEGLK